MTLCDPFDCSQPGSFVHGICGVGCPFLLQGNFLTWISYAGLPHGRQTLSPLSHQGCSLNILRSQRLQEAVLGLKSRMSLCVFLAGYMLQLYRFHRANDCFWTPYPSSRFTKTRLPAVLKLCKFTPRTQGMIHVWWHLDLFLPCLAKSVLSEDFSARNGKQLVFLRKHKYLMKLVVIKKGKMYQCVSH